MKFWDDEANGFKVPDVRPGGHDREPQPKIEEPDPEPARDTFMHRMLVNKS